MRQLAASGAACNKALPMDYRALLKHHASGTGAGSNSSGSGTVASSDDAVVEAAAASGSLGLEEPWEEEAAVQAPPPKRGRYVTAGPADPGTPSLQYCTALHLAALQGQAEVVQALLATGQVCRVCVWGGVSAA